MPYGFNDDKSKANLSDVVRTTDITDVIRTADITDVVRESDLSNQNLIRNGITISGSSYLDPLISSEFVLIATNIAFIQMDFMNIGNWAADFSTSADITLPLGYELYYDDDTSTLGNFIQPLCCNSHDVRIDLEADLRASNYRGQKKQKIFLFTRAALDDAETFSFSGLVLLRS